MTGNRRIVHVGNTGGTSIRIMLRALRSRLDPADAEVLPIMLSHDESRHPWRDDDVAHQSFAVVFRDPDRRYVSGFMNRLRQGRPDSAIGVRLWSPAEAAAFAWFREPDALFEALGSADEAEQSAAHFAMNAIFHVKRDHVWYLGTAEEFESVRERFWFVRPLTELSEHIDQLLSDSSDAVRLQAQAIFERRQVSEAPHAPLSARSRELLRAVRPEEYALHVALVAESARRSAR